MLRTSSSFCGLRFSLSTVRKTHKSVPMISSSHLSLQNQQILSTRSFKTSLRSAHFATLMKTGKDSGLILKVKHNNESLHRYGPTRSLSSKNSDKSKANNDGSESQELVLTPGEKVVAGTRLTVYAGIFALASVCAYYIGKELFPTKMSPNTVFNKAFDRIRTNEEIKRRFGEPLKAFGRDHNGHREGRRNFIEHTEYKDKDDGSNRARVRFNLEGQYGSAFVFAEVSSEMPSGEFVYIIVQDKRNGQVINIIDNRSALLAQRMAGGSAEGRQALQNLLGGSNK